jgi:DNA-3-methyladenine glycosylase I
MTTRADVPASRRRCRWAKSPLDIRYHDREWGVPVHDDRRLFECLILEGAQAGLSWSTILRKRPAYRKAFDNFDARKIARYSPAKVRRLLADAGIVRHRGKIEATIANARAFLAARGEHGTFDRYVRSFATPEAMSKDLIKRGFRFVGPTICEAFMQAIGMIDAHEATCFRRRRGSARAR